MKEQEGSEWNGTPTELHELLNDIATKLKIDTRSENWPKASNWVWRRIAPLITNLRARGIKASRASGEERTISLVKDTENTDDTVSTVEMAQNQTNMADSIADNIVEHAEEEMSPESLAFNSIDSIDSIIPN